MKYIIWQIFILTVTSRYASCSLSFSPNVLDFNIKECSYVSLATSQDMPVNSTIQLYAEYRDIVSLEPSEIIVQIVKVENWMIKVCGGNPGYSMVGAESSQIRDYNEQSFLHVTVRKVYVLKIISDVIGWIYFTAWSISFYPQIYENYVRKSVIGLNFDFLSLNIVGFTLYSLYNGAMYYIPDIKRQYYERHPKSLNPVMFNDVFFSFHAVFASGVTIFQAFIYEKSNQNVSSMAKLILLIYYTIVLASVVGAYIKVIDWLDFFYYCSYIKLSVTLIKYIPQAVMNYTRKSTEGWCIGNVLLDFTGGLFSTLQMMLQCFNYDDWQSLTGDPTKLGLGLFSMAFDFIFIYQHYILYRSNDYSEAIIDNAVAAQPTDAPALASKTKKHSSSSSSSSHSRSSSPSHSPPKHKKHPHSPKSQKHHNSPKSQKRHNSPKSKKHSDRRKE